MKREEIIALLNNSRWATREHSNVFKGEEQYGIRTVVEYNTDIAYCKSCGYIKREAGNRCLVCGGITIEIERYRVEHL